MKAIGLVAGVLWVGYRWLFGGSKPSVTELPALNLTPQSAKLLQGFAAFMAATEAEVRAQMDKKDDK